MSRLLTDACHQSQAIDDINQTLNHCNGTAKKHEGKTIIDELARLMYELQQNQPLSPLRYDGEPDIAQYNEELAKLGSPTWYNVPWLYSECYLYRYSHDPCLAPITQSCILRQPRFGENVANE